MPDRYDKAICAAEIKRRDSISARVREGFRPQRAFQVETTVPLAESQPAVSSDSETSVSPTASDVRDQRINGIAHLND